MRSWAVALIRRKWCERWTQRSIGNETCRRNEFRKNNSFVTIRLSHPQLSNISSAMKQQMRRRSNPVSLSKSRWTAYAAAGAATAFGGVAAAEAQIHYSGPLNVNITLGGAIQQFTLDNGAVIRFVDTVVGAGGAALFRIQGAAVSNQFRGFASGPYRYVERVAGNALISGGAFANFNGAYFATLAFGDGYTNSQFLTPGVGFIGFRFNGGGGIEYGWARVNMNGAPNNTFTLVDFAWADTGNHHPGRTDRSPRAGLARAARGGSGWLGFLAPAPLAESRRARFLERLFAARIVSERTRFITAFVSFYG